MNLDFLKKEARGFQNTYSLSKLERMYGDENSDYLTRLISGLALEYTAEQIAKNEEEMYAKLQQREDTKVDVSKVVGMF